MTELEKQQEITHHVADEIDPNKEMDDVKEQHTQDSINTQPHYIGPTSWYKVANDWELNPWESDICKRIIRCRHKGNFEEDLIKTKKLIDIYLKEYDF